MLRLFLSLKVRKSLHTVLKSAHRSTRVHTKHFVSTQNLFTFDNTMSAVPVSEPEGSAGEPRDQASWMETVSFCNGFCDWMDEEWSIRSQMTVKSTEPSEASTALFQPSPKNTEEKNPTGEIIISLWNISIGNWKFLNYITRKKKIRKIIK